MLQDFKKFMMRGNVMDLAVGVIIGAAFGKIVDSLVNDVIMPILGIALKGVDFANLFYVISAGATPGPYASLDAAKKAGASVLAYGSFINAIVYFIIIGFVIFWLVKVMNNMVKKKAEEPAAAPPAPAEDVVLLREIRDALQSR
jgi:large conductance mechanosensitive channel